LDEGEKVKVGENSGRELLGKKFDILGRVERSAKIKVGGVDRPKESVIRHNRVKQDIDSRERSDLGGGGAGRGKTVTTRSAANTMIYARRVAALGAGEEERSGGPLLLRHGIIIRGEGGGVVDGTEGPGSLRVDTIDTQNADGRTTGWQVEGGSCWPRLGGRKKNTIMK
jgi:hypothetical protein